MLKNCLAAVLLLATFTATAININLFRLDLDGPLKVTSLPRDIATPTRVEVYRKGPNVGFDDTSTVRLSYSVSDYTLTNGAAIAKLVDALAVHYSYDEMTNAANVGEKTVGTSKLMAYTYHFCLLNETNNTMMVFRVLEPAEFATRWRELSPKSEPGFKYYNNTIGPWIEANLKRKTIILSSNVPAVLNTQTNPAK